jgi:PPP family 3-phenylpropionic acid transporter
VDAAARAVQPPGLPVGHPTERVPVSEHPGGKRSSGEGLRLAVFYGAMFARLGIHLPYWPVWLAHRGMEPDQIGVLLGVFTWAGLIAPWAGRWADRHGRADLLACVLTGACLLLAAAFSLAHGFVPLLILSAVLGLCYAPLIPLVDGIAIGAAADGFIDYGRVRLWGSVGFVVASSGGGFLLQGRSPSLVLVALVAASAALFATTWWLPRPTTRREAPVAESPPTTIQPPMGLFLATTACLLGCHAVLYGFGTRHWQAVGVDESVIGWLWSWGVIAEIALFAVGRQLVARMRPTGLLVLAAACGVVRWPLLALVDSVPVLFAVQTLHGATFAAMHLGAMSWIRDAVDRGTVQRATASYLAISSAVALGVGMPLAGVLFEQFGGHAYHAMALLSAAGLVCALRLARPRAQGPAPIVTDAGRCSASPTD